MDLLDKAMIFNLLCKKPRTDNLNRTQYLMIITAVRELNKERKRSNFISVYIFLKLNHHTTSRNVLATVLQYYIANGYLKKNATNTANYYLTETGKHKLRVFAQQFSATSYLHKKADKLKPLKTKLKRPKTIL